MWEHLKRVIKPNGAIVMTASQPFTTILIASNMDGFVFSWVWNKRFAANFVQAKRQPLKVHEDIVVFSKTGKQPNYYPQKIKRDKPIKKGGNKPSQAIPISQTDHAEAFGKSKKVYTDKHPTSILEFNCRQDRGFHPTQKPVALMEYLIKTYTNPGELVLDFAMGSGTTGVACVNTGRKFIGIELDKNYYEIACKRINDALRRLEK
jgi:site-specific DNA-methyltransferase (adenine-specific)